jgi:putative ABC transport system permease protein
MSLFLRVDGTPTVISNSVRDRIHVVAPDQPVQSIENVADLVSQSVATRRYTLILVGAFTGIGLLLAAVGVYGVISYATSQRTREFGVRIALGATRARVISNVLRDGMVLIAVGSVFGVAGALVVTRSLSGLLYEVSPLDALSFCAAVGALATISLCACLLPAWKASRVDPIIAIRSDC